MKTKLFTKTLLASAMTFAVGSAIAAPYEIIDLGKIEGGNNSFAFGINELGEVVGHGNGPTTLDEEGNEIREYNSHAVQFLMPGVVDLGALDDALASFALAINDNGLIVGYSDELRTETDEGGNEFFIRENFSVTFNSGIVAKIPGLEGLDNDAVFDVDQTGMAVGSGRVDLDPEDEIGAIERGFVINAIDGSGLVMMPSLQPDSVERRSYALSINDNGDIVGWSEVDGDNSVDWKSFITNLSDPTTLEELPTLGTPITVAKDINNNGAVVGYARHSNNSANTVAFVYDSTSDTELTRLPFFDERFDNSVANAINDSGQIVGQALVSVPTTAMNTGFLFENNELKDLNKLISCNTGWRIDNATNINNSGEIIGYGLITEEVEGENISEVRAFKLVPTGGAIEVCEEPDDGDDDNSNGGALSIFGLLTLLLVYSRRKFS